jgi:AraC family transcriptional activator of pobA
MSNDILHIKSITQLHAIVGAPKPKHPLISILDYSKIETPKVEKGFKYAMDFYSISMKGGDCGITYGRKHYDFEEGVMVFTAPNQTITIETDNQDWSGWVLNFHPDLFKNSSLGQNIRNYSFFSYSAIESLHLSDDEKMIVLNCIQNIQNEYNQYIDNYSQTLLVSNLELLLNYCMRFFGRQFNTRTSHHQDIVKQFENHLRTAFSKNNLADKGLPTVQECAEQINLSPNYLSDLLKKETGKTAQEHIHLMMIDKAKTLLMTSSSSIKEIAYELGFEYPHYFSRIFKSKTGQTPGMYRNMN